MHWVEKTWEKGCIEYREDRKLHLVTLWQGVHHSPVKQGVDTLARCSEDPSELKV